MPLMGISAERTFAGKIVTKILKTASYLAKRLVLIKIISPEEEAIVKYGLESIITDLLGLGITLVIGCFFDHCIDVFILWTLSFLLRKNAGGFHACSRKHCIFISVTLLIITCICFFEIEWSQSANFIIVLLFFTIIFFWAPVENHYKPLDQAARKVLQKRTHSILGLEILLFIIAILVNWERLATVITMNAFIVGISIIAGKAKLQFQKCDSE